MGALPAAGVWLSYAPHSQTRAQPPELGVRAPGSSPTTRLLTSGGQGWGPVPSRQPRLPPCPFHEGKVTRRVPLLLTAPSFLPPPEQGGVEPELSQGPLEHPHSPSSFRHSGARAGAWPGQGQPGAAAGFYHPAPGVILRARPAPHPLTSVDSLELTCSFSRDWGAHGTVAMTPRLRVTGLRRAGHGVCSTGPQPGASLGKGWGCCPEGFGGRVSAEG